jgi:hypothetical protein
VITPIIVRDCAALLISWSNRMSICRANRQTHHHQLSGHAPDRVPRKKQARRGVRNARWHDGCAYLNTFAPPQKFITFDGCNQPA